MLLDFFICGVQKAGTTALDRFLRDHPRIEMARVKEVHFFDDDSMRWDVPDYRRLHEQFEPGAEERRRGEATPIYSYWPEAMERLVRYNPRARIVLVLRHPVMRAHAHWRMETVRGLETLPFSEAIRPAARERVRRSPGGVHRVFSYVERGFYAPQAARLLSLFPRGQILFLRTDRLWLDHAGSLRAVHRFLDLEDAPTSAARYIAPLESRGLSPMAVSDLDYLAHLYAADIAQTMRLTGLDLLDWQDPQSALNEPMAP